VYEFVPQRMPESTDVFQGPYAGKPLKMPRDIAVSRNGTIVIADTGNDRVLILDRRGRLVRSIGRRCKLEEGAHGGCTDEDGSGAMKAGDGQFLEPWGIKVSASGEIFVADTWNSRIQALDPLGRLLWQRGSFGSTGGTLSDPNRLYGPRSLALCSGGDLLVSDTGNKRLLRFSSKGEFLSQAGGGGASPGYFNEPVGIAVDFKTGEILVADEWNRRIQILSEKYAFIKEWKVPGWITRSAVCKPYVAVDSEGKVYATDPGASRILVFDIDGKLEQFIHQLNLAHGALNQPTGIFCDPYDGSLWVADSGNNRILKLHFTKQPVAP
jgi:DNA-binding beta-propeller fold protein YncE